MHALFPWVTTELSQKSQACQVLLGFKLRGTGCKSSYYGFIKGYQHKSHIVGKSDNDLYKISKYGVYQTNTSHLKMWQFT